MIICCPYCKTEFEGEIWESGECINCHQSYYFSEEFTEDYSDSWYTIEWDLS
jgi:hypothetical protein